MEIMAIKTPRFKDFFSTWKFQPGNASLEALIENKFGLVIDPFADMEVYRRVLPMVAGFLLGLLFLLVVYLVYRTIKRKTSFSWHYASLMLVLFTL